jgi:hypothetical protein
MERDSVEMSGPKRELGPPEAMEQLSREYVDRVDELNRLRERLDRIGEILMPYGEDPRQPLQLDDLKELLELAEHHRPRHSDA